MQMSGSGSGQAIAIYGREGGEKLSVGIGFPLLGAVPFGPQIGKGGNCGVPMMVSAPDSVTGRIFLQVTRKFAGKPKSFVNGLAQVIVKTLTGRVVIS